MRRRDSCSSAPTTTQATPNPKLPYSLVLGQWERTQDPYFYLFLIFPPEVPIFRVSGRVGLSKEGTGWVTEKQVRGRGHSYKACFPSPTERLWECCVGKLFWARGSLLVEWTLPGLYPQTLTHPLPLLPGPHCVITILSHTGVLPPIIILSCSTQLTSFTPRFSKRSWRFRGGSQKVCVGGRGLWKWDTVGEL